MKTTFVILTFLAFEGEVLAISKPRIAGGQEADKGQFPFVVSIQATNFQEGWHLCGGILIAEQWVLTAAHCLDSEKPEWLRVVSGEHDIKVQEGSEQFLNVESLHQHPDYTYWQKPYHNDIGLIRLSKAAILDSFTDLAVLPPTDTIAQNPCRETGWGATQEGGQGSKVLTWADIPLLNLRQCDSAYNSPDPNSLCAGEGGVGACVGDNGGPLLCADEDGNSEQLVGVMSWRAGCAQEGNPGVYMNIVPYLGWIQQTMQTYRN